MILKCNEIFHRVLGILSEMQGQLLSVCVDQMDNIESLVNGLNPISDGFDTLAKDAEELSVCGFLFYLMISL